MKTIERYYPALTSLIIFIIYTFTLAPAIIQIDAGELSAVQFTLGIAHPTGYPLYTIIGFIVSRIFFFFDTVFALNILASFYCALAVFFIIKLTRLIIDDRTGVVEKQKKSTSNKTELSEWQKIFISSIIGFTVGLGKTFWFQSTSAEVYSLHLLIISLVLYFTIKAFQSPSNNSWYLVAIILALGFSNHMTTILLIPGIAFLFFKKSGFNKRTFLLLTKMLLIFFPLLLILYSYLPIRALYNPALNWGNPVDLERILRHVSGKQYQVWIFSSLEAAQKQFVYFLNSLPKDLGYIALISSLIGIPLLFKRSKTIAVFIAINFIATVFYAINYDIADIDAYFLLAFVSLSLYSVSLLILIINKIPRKFYPGFYFLPILMLLVNYSDVDQSDKYIFEDYTKAILSTATENSMIFGYQWDYFISPSYYYQFVEEFRDDVSVIDKELIRRSWYYNQLKNNMPKVITNVEDEYAGFLKALEPFERDEPYNAEYIERNFRLLLTSLVAKNIHERDIYITPEMVEKEMKTGEFSLPPGYTLVPVELAFKVVKNSEGYVEANPLSINLRFSSNPNKYEKMIENFRVNMIIYRIFYEIQYRNKEKARKLFKYIRQNYPNYRIPPAITSKLSES